MMSAVTRYKSDVLRQLHCSRRRKKSCLQTLEHMLAPVNEEYETPDEAILHSALGTPETVARVLTAEIPAGELTRYEKRRRIVIAVLCILAAAVIAYLAYRAWRQPDVLWIDETTTIFWK